MLMTPEGPLIREKRTPEEVVRAYISALNAGDMDAIAGHVSDDFVNEHTAALGESVVGRDVYRRHLQRFLCAFKDLNYQLEEVIVDGDKVAVAYMMSAIWLGTDAGARQHKAFSIRGMFRFKVSQGLITHRVDYWDSAEFERQVCQR